MNFFRVIGWILWRDVLEELRSRQTLSSMLFFALIVILVFSFSLSLEPQIVREILPGMIWIAFSFTGVVGLGKSFLVETHNECLEGLRVSPAPKGAIYLGKFLGNLFFLLLAEAILFPLFILFFNLEVLEQIPLLLVIFFGGTVGLSALGTLFSAMTVHVRAREVLFPLLLLPLCVPLIIGAVEATRGVLAGAPLSLYRHWLELLGVFDIVFLVASYWLFEWIIED